MNEKNKNQSPLLFASFLLILSLLGQFWLPWWILMLISAGSALLFLSNALKAFAIAFAIIFVQWFAYTYWINSQNEFILAEKIAQLFKLNNSLMLILLASAIAGLTAAFSAASGALLRGLFQKN